MLCNYLKRASSAAFLIRTKTLEDDLRAISNMGIKFLGRASGIWEPDADDEEHFKASSDLAERVHRIDEEIILQACIFEAVYFYENRFPVPAYVLEAFGEPVVERNFRVEDMLFPEKPRGFVWGEEGGIPDLNRLEARMWFYYRATRYIDAGYEALHLGQIHLYTANDIGMRKMAELIGMIRAYAKKHARRHLVLLDAHSHGISINGRLLLDYHAMPYGRIPLPKLPEEKLVLIREGYSEGGINPNGWSGETMPYLLEYDNWGGRALADFESCSYEERAYRDWWGYDQIGWFANQSSEAQAQFLEYTYRWTQISNPNYYFAVPFRRTLGTAAVEMVRADNGETDSQDYYQMNTKSKDCPMGFSMEETVKKIWETGDLLRKQTCNPDSVLCYGGKERYDSRTGLKLPEKVVVYGSFQLYVGAAENDSNSEMTRMYYIGDSTYVLSVVIPYPGEYTYAVSTFGTLSATYGEDTYPRSGSGNKEVFQTKLSNTAVRFTYRDTDHKVKVEFFEGGYNVSL